MEDIDAFDKELAAASAPAPAPAPPPAEAANAPASDPSEAAGAPAPLSFAGLTPEEFDRQLSEQMGLEVSPTERQGAFDIERAAAEADARGRQLDEELAGNAGGGSAAEASRGATVSPEPEGGGGGGGSARRSVFQRKKRTSPTASPSPLVTER